jgi:hypothetical protein
VHLCHPDAVEWTPTPWESGQLPSRRRETWTAAQIEAFQGDQAIASVNSSVGSFNLNDLPKNLPLGSEIDQKAGLLEKALETDGEGALTLARELAEMIAGI